MPRANNYWFKQTEKDLDFIKKTFNGKVMQEDMNEAEIGAMEQYRIKRFPLKFKGRRYNPSYRPNSVKYEKFKRRRYGFKPQLVASGRASRTIKKTSKIVQSAENDAQLTAKAPFYMGRRPRNQIYEGRDWLALNSRDKRFVRRQFRMQLEKARKITRGGK